jgi:hypothetical protein
MRSVVIAKLMALFAFELGSSTNWFKVKYDDAAYLYDFEKIIGVSKVSAMVWK